MSKTVDLNMSDEEYLRLLRQGSNLADEEFYVKLLISFGASPKKAAQVARILTSPIVLWVRKNIG